MTQRQKIVIKQTQRLALNASLHASIRLLRGDTAGLTRYLEEQAAENPHLRLTAPEPARPGDWLPRWTGVLTFGPKGARSPSEDTAAASPSLVAHVLQQVQALSLKREHLRIAIALIEALEPSGWLGGDLAQISRDLAHPLNEVETVLKRLQMLEPTGIFARNLAECLALQAREMGALDHAMGIILQNLRLLAQGNVAQLAKLCQTDEAAIEQRFRLIRRLNPKPGADFSPGQTTPHREPDLLARRLKGGRWQISLNRSALPGLEVVEGASENRDPAALGAAKALGYMLRARNDTLLKVGHEIAQRQQAALMQGPEMLRPMTMADIAESLGLHESTISRVVAGASLDSPHGVWWLRQMFSGAQARAKTDEAAGPEALSAAALRHRLARMVAREKASAPLSDSALTSLLAQETGITLARRTVAKYREMQGIPPAHRRRKPDPARSKPAK